MKHALYRTAICMLTILLMLGTSSCKKKNETTSVPTPPSYSAEQLLASVRLDAYTGLTVILESETETRADAIWRHLLAQAEILNYPEDALAYYVEQEREVYRYYAEQNEMDEDEVKKLLGISEESIEKKAKQLVKKDLVYEYIRKDANIILTEKEKTDLFDRYAQQLADQYGYSLSYVKENMKDHVLDAMLYHKTTEYLILNNQFLHAK